ncbi:MAG TPA: porin, partial [Polyangiales bacterium]|nr:porin [Polyangiales bacterium]
SHMSIRSASLLLALMGLVPLSVHAQTTEGGAPSSLTPPPAETTPPPSETVPSAPAPAAETAAPAETSAPALEPAPAVVAPEPAPAAPPAEAAPEFPKKLPVGTSGFFQPGILLQGWFDVQRADETTANFRIRRAEIHAKGEIIPGLVSYAVMIDPAKALEFANTPIAFGEDMVNVKQPVGSSSIFQDFFITFQSAFLDASIGQFKIPVSYEGYNSSSKLLFAERAPVSRQYGDKRDIGLRLAKTFEMFGYSAGIFNGAGQNNIDNDTGKDLALRLELYPVKGLLIGGVIYSTVGQRDQAGAKDRYEGDLRVELGHFLFQGEFIHGKDVGAMGAETEGNGFYAALAYGFLDGTLQPAVRVGYLDTDASKDLDPAKSAGQDELFNVDVGLTYYLRKQEAKVLLNYYRFEYEDKTPNNQIILSAQVSY